MHGVAVGAALLQDPEVDSVREQLEASQAAQVSRRFQLRGRHGGSENLPSDWFLGVLELQSKKHITKIKARRTKTSVMTG